jgi:hypothetical protein
MEISPRLTAALEYASRGIPVFPLWPGTKDPVSVHRWAPGFKDHFDAATVDHATIRSWFETIGDCNIGFEPERIGCSLIDVDIKKGQDGRDAWRELQGDDKQITPMLATPSSGLHYVYQGSLPPTAKALGEGIDTRGKRSYGVMPPSKLDEYGGEEYTWLVDLTCPFAPLPTKVVEFFANRRTIISRLEAPPGLVLDRPWNIARAEIELYRFVEAGFVAGPTNRDIPCYQVACTMLEFGLSVEVAAELIHEIWEPACDGLTENVPDLVERKLNSAAVPGRMQNAIGCRALVEPSVLASRLAEIDAKVEEAAVAAGLPVKRRRFQWKTPEEDALEPPLEFWDGHRGKDAIIPKVNGGCAIVVYGPRSSHKSGVMLKELVELALNKDARVLYIAAEGANGIKTARLPALMKHLGRPLSDLKGKWVTLAAAPDVLNEGDMLELHGELREAGFSPNFIVMDTGTRCIGFADINSTAIGTAAIVAMEDFAQPYNATLFYVTHPGKDEDRGVIGSKQQENQAFGQWLIKHDGKGGLTVTVEKLKDGRQHFSVPLQVNIDGVPVVKDLDPEELARRSRSENEVHNDMKDAVWGVIYPVLQHSTISRTNRSTNGLSYIQVQLKELGHGDVPDKTIKELLDKLRMEDRLEPVGTEAYKLGKAALAPTSMG